VVKNLIILGAGGDGRTLVDMITEINNYEEKWNIIGFLDDDPKKQNKIINGYSVLGKIIDYGDFKDTYFITMIGNVYERYSRKRINTKLQIEVEKFATIIHPLATVSRTTTIGKGVVIYPGTFIQANVKIGNHVHIHSNVFIGHDSIVDNYVTIASSSTIAGYVNIGEGCYVGMNSSIRDRLNIGKWSVIGMGSTVLKDVEEQHIVAGNPARFLRENKIYK